MKELKCSVKAVFPAGSAELFGLLASTKGLNKWCQGSRFGSKPGSKYSMFGGWVTGRILSLTPNEHISFTWQPAGWPKGFNSVVVYSFQEKKGKTTLTITHTGFPDKEERDSHKKGWIEYITEPLNLYFEQKSNN